MADPKLSKIIGVKVANANIGEFVIVRNLTNGAKLTGTLEKVDRSVALNAAPVSQWENGDEIQAEIIGRLKGMRAGKIRSGGTVLTITASVDTTTPGVSL